MVLMQHDLRCLYGDMLHDISIMQRCRHVGIQKSTEMGKIDSLMSIYTSYIIHSRHRGEYRPG